MAPSPVQEATRDRLITLLSGVRLDGDSWIRRLRQMRKLDGTPACSTMLKLIAHLDLPEGDAEAALLEIAEHRTELERTLGRDPGLRVATADYLCNVKGSLHNPTIVELSDLRDAERTARTDALTDLPNRGQFEATLEMELSRAGRYDLQLAVVMLDIDRFGELNDQHGQFGGNIVLQAFGRCLRRVIRDTDTAARFGGDEFIVLLPETTTQGAEQLARRLAIDIADELVLIGELELPLPSFSFGIASFPEDAEQLDALMTAVSVDLEHARRGGFR